MVGKQIKLTDADFRLYVEDADQLPKEKREAVLTALAADPKGPRVREHYERLAELARERGPVPRCS